MTAVDVLMWVARGVVMSAVFVGLVWVFDFQPLRHRVAWIAWFTLIGVALSIWIGTETING